MTIAQTKITVADMEGKGVVGLADTPGLTTAAMQAKLDELATDLLAPRHNALVDALAESTGAAGIGTADGADVETALAARAKAADVLAKTNETPFAPTADYHPATKKYVDDAVFASGAADMRKAVYDTNDSGVVDDAENAQKLGGQLPSYYGKAPLHLTATLTAVWVGEQPPYTQIVPLPGLAAADRPHIAPDYGDDLATALARQEAWRCVSTAEAGEGGVTFTCFEDKPATAVPLSIEVNR